ncbi:MAG: AGE family epimerase/isomerase, partial [Alphaproteobacteria bacterium]|nr:AGE family epimerase/isomerase [Alphaproteobacteria bacterium]
MRTRTADAPSARLGDWLLTSALPLWSQAGRDPEGGFFERIDTHGRPERGPRRARVLGRQIYAYSRAPALGWAGPASEVVRHGLACLPAFVRADGLVQSRLDDAGRPLEAPIDLYDQAFILFGTAHAVDVVGRDALPAFAATLRAALERFAHPLGGFEEALPRTLPLRANPHMHLLEAGLAWEARTDGPERADWAAFCDGIVRLALERMIDPDTGALHEHFDGDWHRATAPDLAVVEPGHQFEWAWLLTRWGEARGDRRALAAADRLPQIGE